MPLVTARNAFAPGTNVPDMPLAELNTTPLIDVLLVLLVMFILSMPAAFNQTDFPLPQGNPPIEARILPQNTVSIDASGQTWWNAVKVSDAQLNRLLSAANHRAVPPLIRFQPESQAPYGRSLQVLGFIKASDPAGFAFAGNEQFADFGRPETRR